MLSRALANSRRIPLLRPLRPPNIPASHKPPQWRLFTQNSQLLLISKHSARPQLPYLSQPSPRLPLVGPGQYVVARLLSTETRERFVEQAWLTVKYTATAFAFFFLGSMLWFGVSLHRAETTNPTPEEWRFRTRHALRIAREEQNAVKDQRKPIVDWARVASALRKCLSRLESPEYDGKGLLEAGGDGEEILIPGVGRTGFDVSAKGDQWRAGYFEVVMGCATAAEFLDGMVVDATRGHVFPKEMVVGPSNPDPRPVPSFISEGVAPLEENCGPVFDPPEVYYMRVLTGKGFTTKQKLQAAEGYANWLEFKGLPGSAEEMYRWGIDIAKAAVPVPEDVIMDANTNVLKENAGKEATPNLLRATTSLATHYARTGNVSAALPILLSVLRARRNAPISNFLTEFDDEDEIESNRPKTDIGAFIGWVGDFVKPPRFPTPSSSGDDPIMRLNEKPTCEEGELMVYVGEILFANNPDCQGLEGIGWTRQAVRIAEANLSNWRKRGALRKGGLDSEQQEDSKKCKQCLLAGLGNWEMMLERLSSETISTASREGGRSAGWLEWRGWFGKDGGVKGAVLDAAEVGVMQEELKQVQKLRLRVQREALEEEMMFSKGVGGGTWIG